MSGGDVLHHDQPKERQEPKHHGQPHLTHTHRENTQKKHTHTINGHNKWEKEYMGNKRRLFYACDARRTQLRIRPPTPPLVINALRYGSKRDLYGVPFFPPPRRKISKNVLGKFQSGKILECSIFIEWFYDRNDV